MKKKYEYNISIHELWDLFERENFLLSLKLSLWKSNEAESRKQKNVIESAKKQTIIKGKNSK